MSPRTYFMLLEATVHWRALDADAQRAVFDDALMTVFNGYPELRMSRYSAGALHARCTHLIVWELLDDGDVEHFDAAVQALREQPFFGYPLFEIVDVIPAIEDDVDTLTPLQAFVPA